MLLEISILVPPWGPAPDILMKEVAHSVLTDIKPVGRSSSPVFNNGQDMCRCTCQLQRPQGDIRVAEAPLCETLFLIDWCLWGSIRRQKEKQSWVRRLGAEVTDQSV